MSLTIPPKYTDLILHVAGQVAVAGVTAMVLALSHTDWSVLGPYSAFAQMGTAGLVEIWNTFKPRSNPA